MTIDVERLLEKIDLADLAERAGAQLKRSGRGWRGACPLHGGDNASAFSITVDDHGRQRWHCFTDCDAGGDAIDFVRRWRNLPDGAEGFLEAVRALAEIAGIPLAEIEESDPALAQQRAVERQARRQRQDLLALAAAYYARVLASPAGQKGRAYAAKRGWSDETVAAMGLGAADGRLLAHLREQNADLDAAREAGLLLVGEKDALHDAIPSGYLVYVHRLGGEVTYLSGRATFTDDKAKKARNLAAPKRPYWALRKHRAPLLVVEGQACAITAWQIGYNAVALCGTHLDERSVKAVQGYSPVYLALDNDAAADKVRRVADLLGPLAMALPPWPAPQVGKEAEPPNDLNAWLQSGGTREELAALLGQARPWIEAAIEQASEAPAYELAGELEHLAQLVAALPAGMAGRYVREICERRRLSTARDFRELLAAYDQSQGDRNGFEALDGQLSYYGDPLCNFDARITHELIQDDGLNPPAVLFTVAGNLAPDGARGQAAGEPLEPIEVRAEEFEGMRWVGRHWGARPVIYVPPGKAYLLRRAVQEVSLGDLRRERVYTFTGWKVIEGRRCYLTASGGLGAAGLDESVRVDLGPTNLNRYALPAPPADLRPAIQASLGFLALAPNAVTLPLWLAMYAAPLTSLISLNAILWVYGPTQSGKSTLAHLALTHFGPSFVQGHEYRAPRDWTSTATDLEGAMFAAKDTPIILDDYAPTHSSATEARQMAKKAQYVIRSVGNRSSRGRANADLSERPPRPPRGLVIATAEQPIVGQSTVGRTIYVPVEPGQVILPNGTVVQETALDEAQALAASGLYAQAMAGYVAWLAGNWERLERELPGKIEQTSRVARGQLPAGQSRLNDYYALLASVLELALSYAAEHGAVAESDVEGLEMGYRLDLLDLLRRQGERVAGQSPVVKFFEALEDLLAQRKACLAPRLDGDFAPPHQAELVGWYDDDHIYLLTNTALALVKGYWEALDERYDTLADALRRELHHRGLVTGRDVGHFEKKAYINTEVGRKRVLVLSRQTLRESGVILFGEGEGDGGETP